MEKYTQRTLCISKFLAILEAEGKRRENKRGKKRDGGKMKEKIRRERKEDKRVEK